MKLADALEEQTFEKQQVVVKEVQTVPMSVTMPPVRSRCWGLVCGLSTRLPFLRIDSISTFLCALEKSPWS